MVFHPSLLAYCYYISQQHILIVPRRLLSRESLDLSLTGLGGSSKIEKPRTGHLRSTALRRCILYCRCLRDCIPFLFTLDIQIRPDIWLCPHGLATILPLTTKASLPEAVVYRPRRSKRQTLSKPIVNQALNPPLWGTGLGKYVFQHWKSPF